MRRPALSASRSLDVIDFLASLPGEAFTLSQIARAVGINVATCHAILNKLTERGYLSRNTTRKSYSLGPALIGIGNAALRSQRLIAKAQSLGEAINRDCGVPVALTRLIGQEIVGIFTIMGRASAVRHAVRPGSRLPLMAPVGAPFMAWSSAERIEEWIRRRPDAPNHKQVERWHMELQRVRERGFQVLMRSPRSGYFPKLLSQLASGESVPNYKNFIIEHVESNETMCQLEEIEPEGMYDVMLIAAPIFDAAGEAVYNFCIGDFPDKVSGDTIQHLADRLVRACVQLIGEQAADSAS